LADERFDGRADQVRLRPKAREVRVQGVVHGASPRRETPRCTSRAVWLQPI
jgi:hypothetical protein